jgi:citrate synthase
LRERKEARRDPANAAARGLHWGGPVLESGITLIDDGKIYYRGQDVASLARTKTLEEVAELLWDAGAAERGRLFEQGDILNRSQFTRLPKAVNDEPLTLMQMALPAAGSVDLASFDLSPRTVCLAGARILRLLTAAVAGGRRKGPVHRALQAAWAPTRPEVAEAIRMALVLCADHELNPSTFVARCAASAGASPYDVISAALATLKGHRHGGETERLSALIVEVAKPGRAKTALASRLRRGERIPGFGHPLYPEGDPRAALLLEAAAAGGNKEWKLMQHVAGAGEELLQAKPNLDFGLVAVARTFGLPERAPLTLFALGRTVGWIAHAIEQYGSEAVIRPRARYTGPAPAPTP